MGDDSRKLNSVRRLSVEQRLDRAPRRYLSRRANANSARQLAFQLQQLAREGPTGGARAAAAGPGDGIRRAGSVPACLPAPEVKVSTYL
jgi:hypothetical protein